VYDKVDTLLNSTSKLMLDELRQDGEPIKFMDILERDKVWQCHICEEVLSKDVIYCEKCQIFRPLEMFKHILHDPANVTDQELNFLDTRRKMEKQLILDKDVNEDDDDPDGSEKKMWFVISGDWLY
jgi:hypothetical protein